MQSEETKQDVQIGKRRQIYELARNCPVERVFVQIPAQHSLDRTIDEV